jgi:NAD(P)-dependent dehydrogenase (short-subunit alcohol dehydrogenase family)
MLLANRVALITGGSRGLGRALSQVFSREGATVAFLYESDEKAAQETLASLVGEHKRAYRCSVLDAEAIEATTAAIEKELGPIDILVNNAGVAQIMPFAMIEEEDWDRLMDVNVKGAFLVSRAVTRRMIRRQYGRVLNMGSLAGTRVMEAPVHYCTSKAALNGFTQGLAKELARYHILVNCLAPGLLEEGVGTKISEPKLKDYIAHSGIRRLGTTAEVAEFAAFLCSEKNSYLSGSIVVADGALG